MEGTGVAGRPEEAGLVRWEEKGIKEKEEEDTGWRCWKNSLCFSALCKRRKVIILFSRTPGLECRVLRIRSHEHTHIIES